MFSPATSAMAWMLFHALYPYLTLYLADTNPFSDDEESRGIEECWDTVLATISVAAVAQSCIVLAGSQGAHRNMIAAETAEFLDVNEGAPRVVILDVSSEIGRLNQAEREWRPTEVSLATDESQRMEWSRLLPAARQEIIMIRRHGQFPILIEAQRIIRLCQRDGLELGFLGRNTEPTREGPPFLSPDLSIAHTLCPPTGLPQVGCQYIPGKREGEFNTFFYFTDET
jgi:hypothetical protein